MAIYCKNCGAKMELEYEDHWYCSSCGNWMFIDSSGEEYWHNDGNLVEDYDEVYNDDFCKTCDSDSYPMCRGGCPYIDE